MHNNNNYTIRSQSSYYLGWLQGFFFSAIELLSYEKIISLDKLRVFEYLIIVFNKIFLGLPLSLLVLLIRVRHFGYWTYLEDLLVWYIPICTGVSTHGTLEHIDGDSGEPRLGGELDLYVLPIPYQLGRYNKPCY